MRFILSFNIIRRAIYKYTRIYKRFIYKNIIHVRQYYRFKIKNILISYIEVLNISNYIKVRIFTSYVQS